MIMPRPVTFALWPDGRVEIDLPCRAANEALVWFGRLAQIMEYYEIYVDPRGVWTAREAVRSGPEIWTEASEARRKCAEIVRSSMKYYEDEECTGTMRIALECIAKKIESAGE